MASLHHENADALVAPIPLFIAKPVLDATLRLLTSYGGGRHEGVVYWAGHSSDRAMLALQAIAPNAETGPGYFRTSVVANAAAISHVCNLELELVAQIHSHPGGWVEHSEGDDRGAFKPYRGTYSFVVPAFGNAAFDLGTWGAYWWDGSDFRPVPRPSVRTLIRLVATEADLRPVRPKPQKPGLLNRLRALVRPHR